LNHIVFHNDVDGIMSAALLRQYETEYRESCIYPAASTQRGGQVKKFFNSIPAGDKVAIVDFEYNGLATLWIDHHFNTDLGPSPVKTDRIFYDPAAKSAVELVMERCGASYFQEDTVKMCNMIDSAAYPDVNFIFESDHPLMILRAYLETAFPSDMMFCRIVEMITTCECDVAKSLVLMRIDDGSVKDIRSTAKKIDKHIVQFGACSVVNQTRQNQFPRYSEYFVRPRIEYAIRISLSGPHQKYIQIGHNQWSGKQNTINLGEFMRGLSYIRGGGHFNIAAGVMKNEDEQKFLDDVDIRFNQEETDMEKYGVDKNDPVESRAQDLVKTGVDIGAAREQSQKEIGEKSDAGNEGELQS